MSLNQENYEEKKFLFRRYIKLPKSWDIIPLKKLISDDVQPGFSSGDRDENGILQLRMNNIGENGVFDFDKTLCVPIPENIKNYDIKKNDVLFNNTNSLELVGKTVMSQDDMTLTFSNHISRIRTDDKQLSPYFLALTFLRYRKMAIFQSICNIHVGQVGIGKTELKKLPIICPPIKEQKKIVDLLRNVDSLIRHTKIIAEQNLIIQKILIYNLFTKGIKKQKLKKIELLPRYFNEYKPEGWKHEKLANLLTILTDGTHDPPPRVESGIPLLASNNIHDGIIDFKDDISYVSEDDYLKMHKNYEISIDDLLLTTVGTLGRVSKVKTKTRFSIQRSVALFRTNEQIIPDYLYYFMQLSYFQNQLNARSKSTAQTGIYLGELGEITIWFPEDPDEQKQIVNYISNYDDKITFLREYAEKLQDLKNNISTHLLSSKIRLIT